MNPYFIATLSDGTIFEENINDNPNSWYKLKDLLKDNKNLKIIGIQLQFDNSVGISMPNNKIGYFYGKRAVKVFPFGGESHGIGVGFLRDDGLVDIEWYNNNGNLLKRESRPEAKAGFFLIKN